MDSLSHQSGPMKVRATVILVYIAPSAQSWGGNICGQILSGGDAAVKVLPAKGSRSGSGGVAL